MKAIVEYTNQEYEQQMSKYIALVERVNEYTQSNGCKFKDLMVYERHYGYAHYTFKGTYTDSLIDALGRTPTPDEIIMLIDGGFSHFGATCTIDTSRHTFDGRVNID